MEQYLNLIQKVLENGTYEENRTKEETIAVFSHDYSIDVGEGYPLLTTKEMNTFRWDSMLHELEWYLSGEHHVRNLTEHTSIWDAWSDEDNNLPSAYGRFWRRFPVPSNNAQLPGEDWVDESNPWTNRETPVDISFAYSPDEDDIIDRSIDRTVSVLESFEDTKMYFDKPQVSSTEDYQKVVLPVRICGNNSKVVDQFVSELQAVVKPYDVEQGDPYLTLDQLKFNVDALKGENKFRGPESRRLIVQAWNPANAQVSSLPPCHYTFLFNVQNGELNLHLTQRSADIALGVPFNIAAYALILRLVAKETGYDVGTFSHSLVDAHIYCGKNERSEWYANNLSDLQERVRSVDHREGYRDVRNWLLERVPEDPNEDADSHKYGHDHTPGLLEQLSREPKGRSRLNISEGTTIENVAYNDFELEDYDSYGGLRFSVAE